MTQAGNTISIRSQVRDHRIAAVAALLALLATAAVVLALTLDGGTSGASSSAQPQVSNGPQESAIAAAVGSSAPHPAAGPDESRTAASVAGR